MKKKILVGYIMDGTSGGIDRYLLRFIEQVWEEDIQIDVSGIQFMASCDTVSADAKDYPRERV